MEAASSQIPARIPTHGTQELGLLSPRYAYGAITLYGWAFQPDSASAMRWIAQALNPTSARRSPARVRFGLFPFRSPLLGESPLISLPPPTEMFHFGGFPLPAGSTVAGPRWEGPFGHPQINDCMHLPGAYRSLPRPSSAPEPSYPSDGIP